MPLPPGTLLQLLYVKERIGRLRPGTFIEIGVGQGLVSKTLLGLGWSGVGLEVDPASTAAARFNNASAIEKGRYAVAQENWTGTTASGSSIPPSADLIISSMVLEHLDDRDEEEYFARCKKHLAPGGLCVLLVPASMRAWGIEDEIAGHYRRYSHSGVRERLARFGWKIDHIAGLTFPLSNLLLPISNWLVMRSEADKRSQTMEQRTQASGRRRVYGKTIFPDIAAVILNEFVLYPFHLLQKLFSKSERALVLYVECVPASGQARGSMR